jgi:FlaA1/EpsC-like NDP-sugar epimerase
MTDEAISALRGKRVMITGVAGTIGQALLQRVVGLGPLAVIGIDINGPELRRLQMTSDRRVSFFNVDIRDLDRLVPAFAGVDIIFHAAARKDVGVCERDPRTAEEVNVGGTQNVLTAARKASASTLIYISTDKAVQPASVMGTTKLRAERLVLEAQGMRATDAVYSVVRFVNVLGSSGSVVPLFRRQIRAGGPVSLTDARMTRFVMGLREAIDLILEPLRSAIGGEVFLPRSSALRIADLATVLIAEAVASGAIGREPIEVRTIGARPGEKIHEKLMTAEEARRAIGYEKHYVIPGPGSPARSAGANATGHYVEVVLDSGQMRALSLHEVRSFLQLHGLLIHRRQLGGWQRPQRGNQPRSRPGVDDEMRLDRPSLKPFRS